MCLDELWYRTRQPDSYPVDDAKDCLLGMYMTNTNSPSLLSFYCLPSGAIEAVS